MTRPDRWGWLLYQNDKVRKRNEIKNKKKGRIEKEKQRQVNEDLRGSSSPFGVLDCNMHAFLLSHLTFIPLFPLQKYTVLTERTTPSGRRWITEKLFGLDDVMSHFHFSCWLYLSCTNHKLLHGCLTQSADFRPYQLPPRWKPSSSRLVLEIWTGVHCRLPMWLLISCTLPTNKDLSICAPMSLNQASVEDGYWLSLNDAILINKGQVSLWTDPLPHLPFKVGNVKNRMHPWFWW